jgi:hypothetical protein
MPREFEWIQPLQRYRVTEGAGKGQFISEKAVQSLTLDYLDQSAKRIDTLSDRLISEAISVAQWRKDFAETLKEGWTNAWAIGVGGHKNITDRDRSEISQRLRLEFQYLAGFTEDLILEQLSEAQIRDRSRKYTDGFYIAFAHAQDFGHDDAGFTWQKDTLNPAASHCVQCVGIAEMGWVPRGSVPRIGNRICQSRDRCTRQWAKGVERPESNLLTAPYGFIGLPRLNNRNMAVNATL